jgi:hypothetical protein
LLSWSTLSTPKLLDMAAQIIYPPLGNFSAANNGQMINVYDVLYIQYTSTWPSLNFIFFCLRDATSTQYFYVNAPSNPILASGTYKFGSIQAAGFSFDQLPVGCHFMLSDPSNGADALNGQGFYVTSNSASSTTFQPATATAGPGATTTTQGGTRTSGVAASTSTSTTTPSSGLSTGAKAGIGVGVAVAVLLISALLFVIWHMRQRQPKAPSNVPATDAFEKPELPGSVAGEVAAKHLSDHSQLHYPELHGSSRAELEAPPPDPYELPS